ncbi:MAG: beta-hexosaminidase [Oscillibacter sp.]|nr:beta-hexosaminidase [Oscillibacter sp.]
MKRFFALVLCTLLLSGCGGEEPPAPEASTPPAVSVEREETPPPVEIIEPDPIQDLLDAMTVEEKVGQLFFVRCPAENAAEDVAAYHLGGYILFGRDTKDKTAAGLIEDIASYQAAADIPLLIGVDEEGGTVVRVSSNPHLRSAKFQSPQKVGLDNAASDTAEKDRLLAALGFNVNLAPVADLSTDPNDFIYARSFGQDAEQTSRYVAAVVEQMRDDGMGSVLKHFPGYGNNVDTHTGIALDTRPLEQFMAEDFLPFEAGLTAGGETTAVLVSHNIVESMDPQLPASLSPAVHEILRDELGFEGVIMTDDLAMEAVSAYAGDGSAAVMAIEAGNDLIITTDHRTQIPKVMEAVESGALELETIESACRNVLEWKQALGLI